MGYFGGGGGGFNGQLTTDLELNGFRIISTPGNGNVVIEPGGAGKLVYRKGVAEVHLFHDEAHGYLESKEGGLRVKVEGAPMHFDFLTDTVKNELRIGSTPHDVLQTARLRNRFDHSYINLDTSGLIQFQGSGGSGGSALALGTLAADPGPRAGYAFVYAKLSGATVEVFVKDGDGSVTLVSPHAPDAPEWLYDAGDSAPRIVKEYNLYTGIVRYTNESRRDKLLSQGVPATAQAGLTTTYMHSESFAEHEARTGEHLQIRDWQADQDELQAEYEHLRAEEVRNQMTWTANESVRLRRKKARTLSGIEVLPAEAYDTDGDTGRKSLRSGFKARGGKFYREHRPEEIDLDDTQVRALLENPARPKIRPILDLRRPMPKWMRNFLGTTRPEHARRESQSEVRRQENP